MWHKNETSTRVEVKSELTLRYSAQVMLVNDVDLARQLSKFYVRWEINANDIKFSFGQTGEFCLAFCWVHQT